MKTMKCNNAGNEHSTVKRILWSMSLATILFFIAVVVVQAQSYKLETDKGLEDAVASYDVGVRQSILLASEYPTVLTQLQQSQDRTVASFQKMIGHFRQKKQEWFYTITRYPELMHKLAYLPAKLTENDINNLLPSQDPDLKEAAWHLYRSEKKNLGKLDNIRLHATSEFEKSIAHLNSPAHDAFRKLQNKPDALSLLTNNIELTSRLGERYRNNPAAVANQLATLHDKLEIQNQHEAAAFKKQMESDKKAMKELRQASSAYAANSYYNSPYYYPYSYWFGYPYWYYYPMWYPGMYSYSPGFYFGVGGLYGFPSYGFSFWFYNGGYYTRYPHLYRQFGIYYQNNVTVNTMINPAHLGFASVATAHYRPTNIRMNSSPYVYRQSSQLRQSHGYMNVPGVNNFHAQSIGGFGGRGGLIGGGSLGVGFHGGFHGHH